MFETRFMKNNECEKRKRMGEQNSTSKAKVTNCSDVTQP